MAIKRIGFDGDRVTYQGEPGNKPAESYQAAANELASRIDGMPRAIWDANAGRMVPVAYDVEIVQLVSDDEHRLRERNAAKALLLKEREEWIESQAHRNVTAACVASMGPDKRAEMESRAAFNRYTNALQAEDGGVALSFLTRSERALASYEWGKRLRELVDAGKRRDEERDRCRVLVDIQDED